MKILKNKLDYKYHMKAFLFIISIIVVLYSCNKAKQTAKDTINKSGEVVGKGSSEFLSGIKEGIDKTFQCDLKLSDNLSSKGVRTGKFAIGNSKEGNNNMLTTYLIFDKDIKQKIRVTVMDKNGKEYGRSTLDIEGKKDDAKYFDFVFDNKTNIESKSTFVFE